MTLIDNEDQKKKIVLKPGEMVLYESAKVPHGRQFPLEGEYYQNILVHFGPMDAIAKSHKSSVKKFQRYLNNKSPQLDNYSGHEIDWYDKEVGWTEDRRKKIWKHNILSWDQYKSLVVRHLSQSQLLAIFPHCL